MHSFVHLYKRRLICTHGVVSIGDRTQAWPGGAGLHGTHSSCDLVLALRGPPAVLLGLQSPGTGGRVPEVSGHVALADSQCYSHAHLRWPGLLSYLHGHAVGSGEGLAGYYLTSVLTLETEAQFLWIELWPDPMRELYKP